jgi:adenylate kinase
VEADRLTREGRFVPDAMVCQVVNRWLENHPTGYLLDGYPRTEGQAANLENILVGRGERLTAVIGLECRPEILRMRVGNRVLCTVCSFAGAIGFQVAGLNDRCPECGSALTRRSDDTAEVFETRLQMYREITEPLFEFYRQLGLLELIDGELPSNEVTDLIVEALQTADIGMRRAQSEPGVIEEVRS